jgi:hypothetical protein
MGSGGMLYVPSLIKIDPGIQMLLVGIHRYTAKWIHKTAFIFQNKESRVKLINR